MEGYKEKLKSTLEDKETPLEVKNWIEKQFPELKESEDEKIRKTFIRYAKEWQKGNCVWNSGQDFCNNAIAWLEKQCKPKFNGCGNSNTLSIEGVVRDSHFIDFECGTSFLIPIESSLANGDKVIVTIAKENKALKLDRCACQNFDKEYKSAREKETREPKFKVGDWITNGEYTWKITDVKPLDYILQSQNGDTVDDTISHVDEYFHLWTVQDAKDGDVLATDSGRPFTFKGLLDMYHPKFPVAYCGIDPYNYFDDDSDNDNEWWAGENVYPATKEQRDILFQKMKEAGYEWDDEKKELKKIEQKHAWSEKDEKHINLILRVLDMQQCWDGATGKKFNPYQGEIDWFKSLKDKVQSQPKQD